MVVNFYAPWCPWCQRLEPTWEAVTQEVHTKYPDSDGRIRYAKVCPRLWSAFSCHQLAAPRLRRRTPDRHAIETQKTCQGTALHDAAHMISLVL